MRLAEKVAVITGAAEGIGRTCALQFAREGAAVVVADRNADAGEETAQAIAASGGQAIFLRVDVASEPAVEQLFQHAVAHFGRLDVLLSNAGIGGRSLGDGPVHQCTLVAWEQIMAVNLRGTFLACKYALPAMFERGGSIVTMASVLGLVGTQGLFDTHAYATSKAGIIGLTRTIAAHYARQRIRANAIAPGLIDTLMAARTKANLAIAEQVAFWQPLGVVGQPSDVAAAAVFLASDESQFITGAVLPVDGGWSAQ
jgi:NAD(P)-dependent dehydrogenase (short-subunit alcohol dehydrogenase family)